MFDSEELFGPEEMPCAELWRPEAPDCRALIPTDTWNEFARNLPSGIRTPDLLRLRGNA